MMTRSRSFHAKEKKDERAPVLINTLQHIVKLQRNNGLEPTEIKLNGNTHMLLSEYFGITGNGLDKLFGLVVSVDWNDEAMPIIIISKLRTQGARYEQ